MDRSESDPQQIASALRAHGGCEPQYLALARVVSASIASGELPKGSRLPSQRELAEAADVSRTTVVSAYNLLRAESLIEMRRGAGTWVVRPRPSGRLVADGG